MKITSLVSSVRKLSSERSLSQLMEDLVVPSVITTQSLVSVTSVARLLDLDPRTLLCVIVTGMRIALFALLVTRHWLVFFLLNDRNACILPPGINVHLGGNYKVVHLFT